jgi:hypothetical protein
MNRLFVLFQIGRQEQQRAFSQMSVEVEMILFTSVVARCVVCTLVVDNDSNIFAIDCVVLLRDF